MAAEWWQWVLSIPESVNPLLDETGDDCVVGQRGPIWFLAGTFFGGTAERECPVPSGTRLFFPVINSINVDTPNTCGQGPESIPVAELRALSAEFINGAENLSVTLDGRSVAKLTRIKSPIFEIALPEENVFDAPCEDVGGVPAGVYSPAVDDGFYVLLPPLREGEHELNFHAENLSQGIILDVTYSLTVVPVNLRPH